MMENKLESLKALFKDFLAESQVKSINNKNTKDQRILNSEIFEFQSFVSLELKKVNVNLLINSSIDSEEIRKSFDKSIEAFGSNDYCLSFFDFLNFKKDEKLELYQLIDQYLEAHKDELTWRDIVVTATGATRCKTNIRFALDQLRAIGLIKHIDDNKKRTFTPSIFGELVYFHWRISLTTNNASAKKETNNSAHDINIKEANFAKLFSFFNQLSSKENDKGRTMLNEFLNHKKNQEIEKEIDEILKDIEKFIKNSEITENGIKLKKKVKE